MTIVDLSFHVILYYMATRVHHSNRQKTETKAHEQMQSLFVVSHKQNNLRLSYDQVTTKLRPNGH